MRKEEGRRREERGERREERGERREERGERRESERREGRRGKDLRKAEILRKFHPEAKSNHLRDSVPRLSEFVP
jgi:hypothetical protein